MINNKNPEKNVVTLKFSPYIKVIILKVTDFSTSVLDEQNFSKDDINSIEKFKKYYSYMKDCIIVETEM